MIIIDTNILSTFSKIERLNLLIILSPWIPVAVLNEINTAAKFGYKHASALLQLVGEKKIQVASAKIVMELPASFGRGEKECIYLAKQENGTIITNEKKVLNYCKKENISAVSLNSLLRFLWESNTQTREQVRQIITEIESKDKLIISSKEEIFDEKP